MCFMDFVRESEEGIILLVVVAPGARRDAVVGEYQGRVKISLSAPAVEGKANKALIRYLSALLGCAKSHVQLIRGEKSKVKEVLVTGVSRKAIETALAV